MPLDPNILVYGIIPWYRMGELLTVICFIGCLLSACAVLWKDHEANH